MCKLSTSCHHVLTSFHSYSSTPQRAPVHVDMCSAWKRRGWGWNPLLIAGSQHFAQWPGNHPQSGFTVTSSHWALSPVSPWVHPSCRPRWQRKTESTWSPHLRWPWRVELEVDWEATFREFCLCEIVYWLENAACTSKPNFLSSSSCKTTAKTPLFKMPQSKKHKFTRMSNSPHPPSYKQCASCSWGAPKTIGLSTDSMEIIIWDLFASNSTCN